MGKAKDALDFKLPVFKRDPVVFKEFAGDEDSRGMTVEFELNLYSQNRLLLQSTVRVPLLNPIQNQNYDQAVRDAANDLQASLTEAALFLEQWAGNSSEQR